MINANRAPFDTGRLEKIHTFRIEDVYNTLGMSWQGLSHSEAERRLQYFGRNVIRKVKGKPLWVKFLANFTHLMAILLWLGGLIAFAAHLPQLGVAIWLVNGINGVFSFWQEYRAERVWRLRRAARWVGKCRWV